MSVCLQSFAAADVIYNNQHLEQTVKHRFSIDNSGQFCQNQ
ncbi:hypothetical protein SAMN05660226_00670 [Parapedobacter luteus]|uniref:Uncharacterized protein n=1 Tax=Parapedobacter luteus TaxID=623280 RepID=A0A1T5AEW5_9SPHI|nr:hypothetical protein SAMN05660226_00670 [Parapedobacter luteus]